MNNAHAVAYECSSKMESETPEWIPAGGFVIIVAGIGAMFWGLSFICEEYCVPSITVFCKRNHISDDIAGAIFIGTGLSLPVLFASFVGLFVSHSAIGIGTVIGGDAFNHLVNIGCSIYVSPNRTLKLDSAIFTREMLFYLVSCILLIWAAEQGDMASAMRNALNEDQWLSCLSISWSSSLVLVCCYIFYCIFDAYFQRMTDIFHKCVRKPNSPNQVLLPVHAHNMTGPNNTADAVFFQNVSTRVENNVVNTITSTTIAAPTAGSGYSRRRSNPEMGSAKEDRRTMKSIQVSSDKRNLVYSNVSHGPDMLDCEASEYADVEMSIPRKQTSGPNTLNPRSSKIIRESSTSSNNNMGSMLTESSDSVSLSHNNHSNDNLPYSPSLKHKLTPERHDLDDDLIIDFSGQNSSGNLIVDSEQGSVGDIVRTELDTTDLMDFGDFPMYLKSTFYTLNDFGCMPSSRKWKLRYFSIDEHGMHYRLESHLPLSGPHIRFIDLFDLESVQVLNTDLFELSIRLRAGGKKYTFRAIDQLSFVAVTRKLRHFIDLWKVRSDGERTAMALKSMYEISNGFDSALVNPDSEAVADDMFTVPTNLFSRLLFFLVFPLKYAIYLTVPDVRKVGSEEKALLSIGSSVLWLAAMSYVLVVGLTLMGDWWNISGSIMGLTVAAWAASYPALWSSIVVAKNGYGDVASCNALGSNVFSNYIGLGLPWIVYSAVYGGRPYEALQDDGVVMSIMLLVIILVLYYAMVALSGYTLRAWMVPVMLTTYVAFIGYLVYFNYTLDAR